MMKNFRVVITLLLIWTCSVSASAAQLLIPGGQLIGMALQDGSVTVEAFDSQLGEAARRAGLQTGDRILQLDGIPVTSPEDIRQALSRSDGQLAALVQRGKQTKKLTLFPTATENGPRLGVYLKQGVSGVGTVTYYMPDCSFGALGHGVNQKEGQLLQMTDGAVFPARVATVRKGLAGKPGQLVGQLTAPTPMGQLSKNTESGIYGSLRQVSPAEPLPVACCSQVHTGPARIRSTVQDETLREYSVEILKIYPNTAGRTRNMLLKVTDPALLETTGGIVQGMSGSPIIQDGKLVGAVTHVLVNDPTTGYGIFIENMLDAAA